MERREDDDVGVRAALLLIREGVSLILKQETWR